MAFNYKDYQESSSVKNLANQLAGMTGYKESASVKSLADLASKTSTYKESKAVTDARNNYLTELNKNKPGDWTGGTYGQQLTDIINGINSRKPFQYNLNEDALYNQYKDQYVAQGKMAMMDTMGQAAALTGGYGNSYASTAGNQAYQGYLQGLNAVVPQLYQMAMDAYQMEGQDLYNRAGLLQDSYDREYGVYRDKVSDWQNNVNRLQDAYYNESNSDYNRFTDTRDYNLGRYQDARDYEKSLYDTAYDRLATTYRDARDTEYDRYQDAYNRALDEYQLALAEAKAASSGSGGGGGRSSSGSKSKVQPLSLSQATNQTISYLDSNGYLGENSGRSGQLSSYANNLAKQGYISDNMVDLLIQAVLVDDASKSKSAYSSLRR